MKNSQQPIYFFVFWAQSKKFDSLQKAFYQEKVKKSKIIEELFSVFSSHGLFS
jgi:hypothetical protein